MQKINTIKLNRDFKRLYYKGKSNVHPLLVTYAIKGIKENAPSRMGITVTKKIGKAVVRNRCKRIIRAAYSRLDTHYLYGWDFVFVARTKTCSATSDDIYNVMKKQLENLTSPQKQKNNVSNDKKSYKKSKQKTSD